jgi:hypothetical protein
VTRAFLLAIVIAISGCATSVRRTMPPAAQEWITTLETAKSAAAEGRYEEADRALYNYAQRYSGAAEAREATYWRAVFKLDPANHGGSTWTAKEHLDHYLSDTTGALHRTEAVTLRRLAAEIDSLSHAREPVIAAADSQRVADAEKARQREDELQKENQRLKDLLDKTTQELDRIKKRLTDKNP